MKDEGSLSGGGGGGGSGGSGGGSGGGGGGGKNGGGDLKGTLKGSSVTLDLSGSDRASARQLTRVATLSNVGKV